MMTGASEAGRNPATPGSERMFDSRLWLRLLVAVAASGLIDVVIWLNGPTHLSGHIDVVGYPTFSNYNYLPVFLGYRLVVYAFPLGVILIYALLDWRGPLRGPRLGPRLEPVRLVVSSSAEPLTRAGLRHRVSVARWLRLIPPAVVVALAVRPRIALSSAEVYRLRVASALIYILAVLVVSRLVVGAGITPGLDGPSATASRSSMPPGERWSHSAVFGSFRITP